MVTTTAGQRHEVTPTATPARPSRWWALSGPAFSVLFIGSVVVSSPPADKASDASWVAAYTHHSDNVGHLLTGVFLVVAALALASFLTLVWGRVAATRRSSPLPLVAAAVSAACIAVGGTLMGGVAGSILGSGVVPGADLLRFCNDVGFVFVGLPGMLAASLSIASLSILGHRSGLFGGKMRVFGLAVSVILLAGLAFLPIAALLLWTVVAAVVLIRSDESVVAQPGRSA